MALVPIAVVPPRALRTALAAAVVNGAPQWRSRSGSCRRSRSRRARPRRWPGPGSTVSPSRRDPALGRRGGAVAPFLVFLARAVNARGQVALGAVAGAGTGPDIAAQLWALFGSQGDPGRARAIELVSGGVATACYAVVAVAIAASALGSGRSRRALLVGGFGLLAALPALAVATLCVLGDGGLAFFGPTSVRPLFVAWAVAAVTELRG